MCSRLLLLLLVLTPSLACAANASRVLDPTMMGHLDALRPGVHWVVDKFPSGPAAADSIRFTRIEVYAPDARVIEVTAHGERDLPLSKRHQLIGYSADGNTRVALSFDPGFGNVSGAGSGPGGAFVLFADRVAHGVRLRAVPAEQALPPGIVPVFEGGNDALPSGRPDPGGLVLGAASIDAVTSLRYATVAIDTDNEFMSLRFSNNTTNATAWIADLFVQMNVMYQRDLNVQLVQGTTLLRTGPDPYTTTDTPADVVDLNEFGTYWQNNEGAVVRNFAALLSGKAANGNQSSGIAWTNAYCEKQSYGGSYSVNQIFTNPSIGIDLSARIVGHELGHNFGAWHTHCTSASNGTAPVASNTIDQCYNNEGGSGCYVGAVSCPTTGPGHPLGTLMSYCNVGPPSGPNCGQNVLQFHPVQITTLSVLIAQNTPSCLDSSTDVIFKNGFD